MRFDGSLFHRKIIALEPISDHISFSLLKYDVPNRQCHTVTYVLPLRKLYRVAHM